MHQRQVGRQVGFGQTLEDRQHEAARARVDEEVAVFDAGGDALDMNQVAEAMALKQLANVGIGNGGEDGHRGVVRVEAGRDQDRTLT